MKGYAFTAGAAAVTAHIVPRLAQLGWCEDSFQRGSADVAAAPAGSDVGESGVERRVEGSRGGCRRYGVSVWTELALNDNARLTATSAWSKSRPTKASTGSA